MAILLKRLPLEIRNQIYEEILISKEKAIRLTIESLKDKHSTKVHSAVLRTCKQIYAEASIVFWEHNRFSYTSYEMMWFEDLKKDPGYKNLHRIKHFDLVRCSHPGVRHYYHDESTHISSRTRLRFGDSYEFENIMRSLIKAGCSLKSLRLHFFFYEYEELDSTRCLVNRVDYLDAWSVFEEVKVSNQQHGTSETISADQLDYTFNYFRTDYSLIMKEFTSRVNMAKERALIMDIEKNNIQKDAEPLDIWTIQNDAKLLDVWAKFGQIDNQVESRYIEDKHVYRWTWTLTPPSNRS